MKSKKGISLNDLPERYRKQVLAQIGTPNPAANYKQNTGNESVGKKEIERHYRPIDRPVAIHYHTERSRLADSDGNFTKYFTDALVTSGLLVDDSPKYVTSITHSQEKSKKERIVIEIYESLQDMENRHEA